jgi:surface polysaccharide O-acyltransferase-like enzyme
MAVVGSTLKTDYVHSILFIIIKHEYTFYLFHALLAYCLSYCYENINRHNEYSSLFIFFCSFG